jgi:hypothetical protein
MKRDVHVRLTQGFPWPKKRSRKGKQSLHQQIGRKYKEETGEVLHLEQL